MNLIRRTKEAFREAIERAGGKLVRLQAKTGVSYPIINRLNSGKNKFKDISLQTFEKLFPEMEVTFFRDERNTSNSSGLSPGAKRLVEIFEDLDEEGRVNLLTDAGAIRERHSKNKSSRKVPKVG